MEKFKNLWHSGLRATLNVEAENGQASVTLKAGLGCIPPPRHNPSHRGQAYQRRQDRRQAAHVAAENHQAQTEQVSAEQVNERESDQVAEEAAVLPVREENVIEAEQAEESFPCQVCDFSSNWENGLAIHMSRKHKNMQQLDGNESLSEEPLDEEYYRTRHYWEKGRLGTAYQAYIDANELIEKSDLNKDAKEKEKAKILEARKTAFGIHYKYNPPWSLN